MLAALRQEPRNSRHHFGRLPGFTHGRIVPGILGITSGVYIRQVAAPIRIIRQIGIVRCVWIRAGGNMGYRPLRWVLRSTGALMRSHGYFLR